MHDPLPDPIPTAPRAASPGRRTPPDIGALTPLEARALAGIDARSIATLAAELMGFESCSGREVPIQERMADLYRTRGLDVDAWEIDLVRLASHPAFGAELPRERALGVVGRWGSGAGPTLILNGHVDVVPAGDLDRWSVLPFRGTIRDGRLWGRGAVDMKGSLACALAAVVAVREAMVAAGLEPEGTVLLHSVVGEEDGGLGTLAAIERGHVGDAAIVLEPTSGAVAPAQAGALSFRIRIPGRAAHGAIRTEGENPIERLDLVLRALRGLETRRNDRLRHPLFADVPVPYAICVGRIEAGVWASTVPEALILEGRYGLGIGEDAGVARRELEAAVAGAAQEDAWLRTHPPEITWWGARFEPAAIPEDHPLVTTLVGAATDATGRRPPVAGMPYGADMHLLVNHGATPTVLFGPGDIRDAHAPDESVALVELEAAARTLALMILRFCGNRSAQARPGVDSRRNRG
jgi:acetylornithine deacetylase